MYQEDYNGAGDQKGGYHVWKMQILKLYFLPIYNKKKQYPFVSNQINTVTCISLNL